MKNKEERVGVPLVIWPALVAVLLGILGIIIDDMRLMWIFFIVFILGILYIMIQSVVGNKIPRTGKVIKKYEEEDVTITVHCTRYMLGVRPMVVEHDGNVLAKLWSGNKLNIPLSPGCTELSVYRNKNDKTKVSFDIVDGLEIYLWFAHGELDPVRAVQIMPGGQLPESYSFGSYKHMKNVLIAFTVPSVVLGVLSIVWSLHEIGLL